MNENSYEMLFPPVSSKFTPKVHKILEILLDDPLLTDILFEVMNDKSLFSLDFRLKNLSEYIFMSKPSFSSYEIIEALKARSESPIEVNQLTNKDN